MTLPSRAWSTGNVGRHAIAGIDARPDLELVGRVGVQSRQGGQGRRRPGRPRPHPRGERPPTTSTPCSPSSPTGRAHAMADDRLMEALGDLQRILRAGINVVSSGPVFLQYPYGVVDADDRPAAGRRRSAARRLPLRQRRRPRLRQRRPPPGADRGQRAHRRGPVLRDPQLRHLQPAHGDLRHHGLRPAPRRRPHDPPARRADHGLGQRGAPAGRRPRRRARLASRSGTSACRHRRPSRSTPAPSKGHRRRAPLRGAGHARRDGRSSCSSTSPGCATTWARTGPSRPGTAATG